MVAPIVVWVQKMKTIFLMTLVLLSVGAFADDCYTNRFGKKICSSGQNAVAVNPSTGNVATAQKSPGGVTTVNTNTGKKAAYNPRTGNVATSQTNQNGVKTTQTSRGAQASTKNGVGVAEGPNGTKCAKTATNQGCKK
jgi:hypothetical protein